MFGRTNWKRAMAPGLVLVAAGCCTAFAAEPANRIQFSNPAGAVPLPESAEGRPRFDASIELLNKGNSLGAALDAPAGPLPPAAPSRVGLTSRMLERLDRERNWMQNQPEDLASLPTPEEALGVWKYDLSQALGRQGASTDRSPVRPKTQDSLPQTFDPARSDSAMLPGELGFRPVGSLTPNRVADQGGGFGTALNPILALPRTEGTAGARKASSGLLLPELFPTTESGRIVPDVRELLAGQNPVNPLSGLNDPINLDADSTRRPVAPVTAPSLSELQTRHRFDGGFSLSPATPSSAASQQTVLDEMTAKIQGPSSLSPALLTPIDMPKARFKQNIRESLGRKL
jgi:hypothetical protein